MEEMKITEEQYAELQERLPKRGSKSGGQPNTVGRKVKASSREEGSDDTEVDQLDDDSDSDSQDDEQHGSVSSNVTPSVTSTSSSSASESEPLLKKLRTNSGRAKSMTETPRYPALLSSPRHSVARDKVPTGSALQYQGSASNSLVLTTDLSCHPNYSDHVLKELAAIQDKLCRMEDSFKFSALGGLGYADEVTEWADKHQHVMNPATAIAGTTQDYLKAEESPSITMADSIVFSEARVS